MSRRSLAWGALCVALAHGGPPSALSQIVGPNFPLSVPPCAKVENEPSLVAQGNHLLAVIRGECIATVRASVSRDAGSTWQDASVMPWNGIPEPPIAACSGDSGRFYVVTPTIVLGEGNTIEVVEGRFVGSSFQWQRLTNPVPTPYAAGSLLRPSAVDIGFEPYSGNLLVVYTHVTTAPGGSSRNHSIKVVRSTDGGGTWEEPIELTGPESDFGRVVFGLNGELSVVWENFVLRKIVRRQSSNGGASYGPEEEIDSIRDNFAVEPAGWLSSYNRSNPAFPFGRTMEAPAAFAVAVDRSHGPRSGTWYLVTAEHAAGTVAAQTGVTGEIEPNRFYASATQTEIGHDLYGGVTGTDLSTDFDRFVFDGVAGQTIWVNGMFSSSSPAAQFFQMGGVCVNDTNFVYGGAAVGTRPDGSAPAGLYTLPTTGKYQVTASSRIQESVNYVFSLREYAVDPSSVARDHRDILLCSSTDGGSTWSPKTRVSDGPIGNDEVLPEVVVDGSGRVHVAWYDRRDAPECGSEISTYWTWSDDGGTSFQPSRRVSQVQSYAGAGIPRWQAGDHLGLAAAGDRVYVAWYRNEPGGSGDIWASIITDLPTPVLVSGLAAEGSAETVELRWWASDVREVSEFRVHRATEASEYALIGTVTVRGDGEYRWQDATALMGVRYRYRLEVVRHDGVSLWEGPVVATLPVQVTQLAWRGATPNPFADLIELELATPKAEQASVEVFDVTGHKVTGLETTQQDGRTLVRWEGRDGQGRPVAPGVYLVRARSGSESVVRQVVRMK